MDDQKLSVRPKYGYGFIYCYTSPSGKKYIGQTKTTLKERAKKNGKGYKGCKAFNLAIEKYGWENFEVEILEEVPLDVLTETEIQYILYYDTLNPKKGYNIALDAFQYLGSLNSIPIYSYDKETGAFLEEFKSSAEAERYFNVYHGTIRRVVNVEKRSAVNRYWRTEKFDSISIPILTQKHSKKIYMYDSSTGELINEFDSIREAARMTGYNRCTIQEHVTRKSVKKGKKHTFTDFKVDNLYNESSTTIPSEVGSSESKEK